jgi:hypothetical protein
MAERRKVIITCAVTGSIHTPSVLVELAGVLEPLPLAEPRFGRRTTLTLPLFAPPQKN